MKTAEEVVEGIYIDWNTNDDQYRAETRKRIAQALIAFADERIEDFIGNSGDPLRSNAACLDLIRKARAEALEEAAQLVKRDLMKSMGQTIYAEDWLSERIRALKDKS